MFNDTGERPPPTSSVDEHEAVTNGLIIERRSGRRFVSTRWLGRVVIVSTPLFHASGHLPCLEACHGPGHTSEHEDETRGPVSAHDASSTTRKRDDGERERRPGRPRRNVGLGAVQSRRLLISWIKGCHKRNA